MKKTQALSRSDQPYETEAQFLSVVKSYLEAQPDMMFMRICDRYSKGYSDIFICVRGIFVALELKDNTGKPTAHQLLFLEQLRRAGGIGGVCSTLDEVMNYINTAREQANGRQ